MPRTDTHRPALLVAGFSQQRAARICDRLWVDGWRPSSVGDLPELADIVDVAQADAVLIECDAPSYDFATEIAGLRRANATLPIIAVCARDGWNAVDQAFDAGASDFLMRPFEPRELAARLRRQRERLPTRSAPHADRAPEIQPPETTETDVRLSYLRHLSDELRNPLNAVIGFASIIHDNHGAMDDDAIKASASGVLTSGRQLLGIFENLIVLARLHTDRIDLEIDCVDVPTTLKSIVRKVRADRGGGDETIETSVTEDANILFADENLFRRSLEAVIRNAVKFAPGGSKVSIDVDRNGDDIVVQVRDQGPGVNAEITDHLLEPFFQADRRLGRKHTGLGLGLPIAARIAQVHGGSIAIGPNLPTGTVVTLRFPNQPEAHCEWGFGTAA